MRDKYYAESESISDLLYSAHTRGHTLIGLLIAWHNFGPLTFEGMFSSLLNSLGSNLAATASSYILAKEQLL